MTRSSSDAVFACLREDRPPDRRVPADPLLAIALDFSPRLMRMSETELVLDVSGLGRLIGAPPVIGAALSRALTEADVGAHVALAPTQTAARLLAGSGDPVVVVTADPASAIAPLPVRRLQALETLPPAMNLRDRARPYETFDRWGIATLGDLAGLPAPELSSRLGRRGVALQRLARALDPRPFVPDAETPRYVQRLELEWPIEALEPLSFVLARVLDPLSAALERADRGAAAIRLGLRLTDRSIHTRILQLPAAMRDPRVLRTLLLLDLESHPPSAAVDIVTIELDPAPARITQFSLLQRALPSPETVSTLLARLSALVGEARCGAAALIDTHRPGAFEMAGFDLHGAGGAGGAPAGGAGGAPVLRRQRRPPAIRVAVECARPVHVAVARRGLPGGAVVQAAGPWRTSGGWWTVRSVEGLNGANGATGANGAQGAWNRDEWDVSLSDGALCRIFQDRVTARWFLEGVYD